MGLTDRSRFALYRDRKRGGPPRQPRPCGTLAAYRRHLRHDEEPCDACRRVYLDDQARRYRARKGQ